MKIYLVSFPDDKPVINRIRKLGKEEILLSYYFLSQTKNGLNECVKEKKKGGTENEQD